MKGDLVDRRHGRAPQQARSRATLARIAEAAEALFARNGYDGTTVAAIAARARCSVGAFYARFKDKDGLLRHLHERHCRHLIARVDFLCDLLRAENAALEVRVGQTVRALFRIARHRRGLIRVFLQRCGVDPAFHAREARAWGEVRRRLRPLLLARRAEMGRADAGHAVDFALQLIHGAWINDALHHRMAELTGEESGAALAEDLTAACLAYLGAGPLPPRSASLGRSGSR